MPKLTSFQWFRVPAGYRLVERQPTGADLISSQAGGLFILPVGEERESYRPLETFESLYGVFAKVKNVEDVLDFVRKFGPLTDNPYGDDAERLVLTAQKMRETLAITSRDRIAVQISGLKLAPLSVSLLWNAATKKIEFHMEPKHLLNAIWFQLAQTLAGGCEIRECRFCKEWFAAGPGTVRRIDAEFCTKEHKKAFHSLQRSRNPKPKQQATQKKRRKK